MSEEFRTRPENVALLASAFAVPFALVQPVLGPVGDALGKRRVIRGALCLLAVFALLAPLAPDLPTLDAPGDGLKALNQSSCCSRAGSSTRLPI